MACENRSCAQGQSGATRGAIAGCSGIIGTMPLTTLEDIEVILGDVVENAQETVVRKKVIGTLHGGVVAVPNAQLGVLYFRGPDGEGQVRCNQLIFGPTELDRLKSGLSMGVLRRGDPPGTFMELRMAYLDDDRWARAKEPSEAEFDDAVGGSIRQYLIGVGASAVGTRAQLFGDTTRRRGILAVQMPNGAPPEAFFAVYAASRLIPLMRQIERVG